MVDMKTILKKLADKFGTENVLDLGGIGAPIQSIDGGFGDIIHFEAGDDLERSFALFRAALDLGGPDSLWVMSSAQPIREERWPEYFFKTLFLIHDTCGEISYCTAADLENPYALLWKAPPLAERRPHFKSPRDISALDSSCLERLGGLMVPVTEELALALVGASLAPRLYLDTGHWNRLKAVRAACARRLEIEKKLDDVFNRNKPGQAEHLRRMLNKGETCNRN